jgi:glycosyltransferase involved in cell wall biosynthesis
MPKISVIIPFLNMRGYLPEAVDSVYAQTMTDWELILVDDGSSDGSVEWAGKIVRRDPDRVRLLVPSQNAVHGASAARNRGLQVAGGEYIAFLDGDDIWLPGKMERQWKILEENPRAAMAFARVHYYHDPASDGGEWDQPYQPLREGLYDPPDLTLAFLGDDNIYPCPSATLLRRSALMEVRGFEERFSKVRTDLAVWVKITSRFPVYADLSIVTRYRQHANSSVAVVFGDAEAKWKTDLGFLEWLLEWIDALPARFRPRLRKVAAEKMFRLHLPKVLEGKPKNAWQWRRAMLQRMWKYAAFRTELRWMRRMLPGVRK